jgi:phytoene dehydrogenase-like protein
MNDRAEVQAIVVGGGLAGLTAATLLARGGRTVTLLERSSAIGGRAVTQDDHGFRLNLGPHALYRAGAGARVLKHLGIAVQGGVPAPSGGHAVSQGVAHTLPGGPVSLLTTGLLRLPAKLEFGRVLGTLAKLDTESLVSVPLRAWLDGSLRHEPVRAVVEAFCRLATYSNAPAALSAGAALAQLRLAVVKNVTYLDGGWQTMVDRLRAAAEAAGVRMLASTRVVAVEHDRTVTGVRLADGTRLAAPRVILTLTPAEAAAVVEGPAGASLRRHAEAAVPVRAACLDLGLSSLPRPRSTFALGIDRPLYLSVHSAVARLAPEGHATVQVAKYLPVDGDNDPHVDERELEALLDLIQPGWRDRVVVRRFLPRLVVMNAVVTARAGGTAGRPEAALREVPGLYLAGDWVGPEGMLADASFASAERAASLALGEAASPAFAAA